MQQQGQFITLREGAEAKALIAPELGGWLLRYTRHLPRHGYVEALHFSQEIVDRYPRQMYAGNPLLFPLVSFNRAGGEEHQYEWDGARYPMPQHGFARLSKWTTTRVSETSLVMELSDSAESLKQYPFHFNHKVGYELRDRRLLFRQTVENRGDRVMPFGTGVHPYFNVPIGPEGSRSDCYVELPEGRRVVPHGNWESWTAEPSARRRISVAEDVSGTFFLTDLSEPVVRLVDPKSGLRITFNFADAPQHRFVALWSKSTVEPFYCIEPWTALPNAFARRETELNLLQPGQKFSATMWIEVEEIR